MKSGTSSWAYRSQMRKGSSGIVSRLIQPLDIESFKQSQPQARDAGGASQIKPGSPSAGPMRDADSGVVIQCNECPDGGGALRAHDKGFGCSRREGASERTSWRR